MQRFSHNPIFICGEGRSGTKLLRDTLGKYRHINIFRCETSIFVDSDFHRIRFKQSVSREVFVKSILAMMFSKNRVQAEKAIKAEKFPEEVEKVFFELKSRSLLNAVPDTKLEAFDYLANFITLELLDKNRWLEKTPYHINYIENILSFYPDAKIIVNYRDPRAVVASWLKKDKHKSLLGVVANWNNVAKRILELKSKNAYANKVVFLAYESLILNPESTLRGLSDFIGEQFAEDLLDVKVVNNLYGERGQAGFNQEAVDRWKKKLNKMQCLLIDMLTVKSREALDYPDSYKVNIFEKAFVLVLYLPYEFMVFCFKKLVKLLKWL